jgi:general secretion pathway protein M
MAPLLDFFAEREAMLADRRLLIPRMEAVAAELPALRARLAERRATASTKGITLDGASDALAAANLQSRVEELAVSSGVAIGSTEGLAPANRAPYRRIGLRIVVTGEYEALVRLLAALEAAAPPLVPDNLQIRAGLRPASVIAGSTRLDAAFDVYGFRANDPATEPRQ